MATSSRQQAQLIAHMIEGIDIAMLTTVGKGGYLVSRPLSTQQAQFDGRRVWFFTEADSPKVAEIGRNPKVNLAYASKDKNTYVSLAGDASFSRDRARIDALWSDAMKAFFPRGKTDPNLLLLEVQVRTVEYWDGPGSMLGKLLTFALARVTGNEEVMGENRLIDLTGARPTSRLPPSNKAARMPSRRPAKPVARKKAATKATARVAAGASTGKAAKAAKRTARKVATKQQVGGARKRTTTAKRTAR